MSACSPKEEAIASLFPLDLSGELVVLRACIDAGAQKGVFAVAAVAFGYSRAVKATREWNRLLDGRTFHMTDLNARQGEFAGIRDDEVHRIMVGTVGIIRKHASIAVAVSCDQRLVAKALPVVADKHPDMENLLAAMRSPYGFMCHFAMTALGNRANNAGRSRNVSYVFERGDEGQRGLRAYLEFLGDEPHHRLLLNSYSFNRLSIAPKGEIEGVFHASDLLAWEWARQVNRHRQTEGIRRSLAELAGHASPYEAENGLTLRNEPKLYCRHFSPDRITALANYFSQALVATTAEEANAAFEKYREIYPGAGPEEALRLLSQHRA